MPSKLVAQVEALLLDQINDLPPQKPLSPEPVLAEQLGVSRRTLRSALANLEKRELIRRIKRKGTFPARGHQALPLFQQRARMIGLVASNPFARNSHGRRFAVGAFEEALRHGYNLILLKTEEPKNIYQVLDDSHVDGALLFEIKDQSLIRQMSGRKKPLCLVEHHTRIPGVDSVQGDSKHCTATAVSHLYKLGHRRIAFINADDPELNPERLKGYEWGMQKLKVYRRPEWVIAKPPTLTGGEKGTSYLLSLPALKRPTAIIAFSNRMAYGAMKAIQKAGLEIPRGMSVVGIGGQMASDEISGLPDLTRVYFDSIDLGKIALNHVLDRIKNPHLPRRNTLIPVQIKSNESSGKI
jgi:DNA-binding LacI/PurR family transcriptional regulator